MDIYVYSDESGVMDKIHNDYFVFGGLMFLSKEEKDVFTRKFVHAENCVKSSLGMLPSDEAKASVIGNKQKSKLFRATNRQIRFGVIVHEQALLPQIFNSKKDKQRYLDYAYKIAVKRCFEMLIRTGRISVPEVSNIRFFVDEHSTATNGRYELREALERELKIGTYNQTWDRFFPPLFPSVQSVDLEYCNSGTRPLIRAADIVANHIFYLAKTDPSWQSALPDLFVIRLPERREVIL